MAIIKNMMKNIRRLLLPTAITLIMLAIGGVVTGVAEEALAQAVYVQTPPPADMYEAQPPPPATAGYWVWQKGHWRWNGYRYVWRKGHWVARPAHYTKWVAPHWVHRHGSWYFVEGHWK